MDVPGSEPSFVNYPRGHSQADDASRILELVDAYTKSNQAAACLLGLLAIYAPLTVVSRANQESPSPLALVLAVMVFVVLFALFALIIRASRATATALGFSPNVATALTVLVFFVPCGALATIGAQQGRLSKPLKAYGIRVGMGGPNKADVARLTQT